MDYQIVASFFIFVLGLVIGSFLEALTYRLPRDIKITKGRSFCPHCKKKIEWYDNIPLISYLLLGGKCRKCGKKIPPRAPLLELSTALLFLASYSFLTTCSFGEYSILCSWENSLGWFTYPFLFSVFSIMIAIFVIDIENQIIPDRLVGALFVISFFFLLASEYFYANIFAGLTTASFLLLLHLITKGKGMGLGDVKLAIPAGMILGAGSSLVWLFLSFIIGALVGVGLILVKKAKFGQKIPFGPFLVASFFISLFYGNILASFLFWPVF